MWLVGIELRTSAKQSMLLTTEPSLQPRVVVSTLATWNSSWEMVISFPETISVAMEGMAAWLLGPMVEEGIGSFFSIFLECGSHGYGEE